MAHRWNSTEAAAARRARGARAGHVTVRASGRIPGEEAREANRARWRRWRLAKSLDAAAAYDTGALADPQGGTLTDSAREEL